MQPDGHAGDDGLFPALQGELATYAGCDNLIEAYLLMSCKMAWRLVHGGLPRDYHRRQETTPFLKGRWDVGRQISRHAGRPDRHEVTLDVPSVHSPASVYTAV